MVRKFVSATVSAALCYAVLAPSVAFAQEYRFAGFDAPRGATATVNFRVPLGQQRAEPASYGLSLGYGRTVAPGLDGWTTTRALNVADLRFTPSGEIRNARLASFDLAHLDQDRRLNLVGGGKKSLLLIGAIVVAGVVICVAADCFGDDDDDSEDSPGTN
jgi:hypothetical protein